MSKEDSEPTPKDTEKDEDPEEQGELSESIFINDEGDFGSQFNNLMGEAAPDDKKFNSNLTSSVNEDSKYLSTARTGAFDLSAAARPPMKSNLGQSFKLQLQDLNQSGGTGFSTIAESSQSSGELRIDQKLLKGSGSSGGSHRNSTLNASLLGLTEASNTDLEDLVDGISDDESEADVIDYEFDSCYSPDEMRCLALVAHNHMKPAIKDFVLANKNLLKKFKLTGTNTTMTMLREVFGDDPKVKFGPTCTSGPLGGDAELVSVMCSEFLGGCVFFQDPMSAHPHAADIECLSRQANVHNVLMMPNPATAFAVMTTLRIALKEGKAELIPSFFKTLASPSVAEYKIRQKKVIKRNRTKN